MSEGKRWVPIENNTQIEKDNTISNGSISRRHFIQRVGAITAGLLLNPFKKIENLYASSFNDITKFSTQVGVTQALDYKDPALIKQKIQHLFESIGGISDVIKPGDKVAIKINLTGGSGSANDPKLQGKKITETMWTHPTVVRAVCELLIDGGVSAKNIYIVEAIWDEASYNNFGYKDIERELGLNFINLNEQDPYSDFMNVSTGENHFNFEYFKLNRILSEVDVYISLPKMKQHYSAGVTHTMKNQIGITPMSYYLEGGRRGKLHNNGNESTFLPRSIVDLNLARPVNLGIIDGIMSATGGEGVWNSTFKPAEFHFLLAGKDSVATDSIASFIMGNNPESEKLQLPKPNGGECDNHLYLANQLHLGTNMLSEIELVGDAASLINTSVEEASSDVYKPNAIILYDNFPNPFNSSTTIRYYLPKSVEVILKIINITGREIGTLVNGRVSSGTHQLMWEPKNLSSGIYFLRLQLNGYIQTKKLIYQK